MAWIELTAEDLQNATAELPNVKSIMLSPGVSAAELITETLTQAVNDARGYVPQGVSLADGVTIPEGLKMHVIAIARIMVFSRIQVLNRFITEARQGEADRAQKTLERWQAGKWTTPATDDPAEEQPVNGGRSQLITSRERRFTRDSMNGL